MKIIKNIVIIILDYFFKLLALNKVKRLNQHNPFFQATNVHLRPYCIKRISRKEVQVINTQDIPDSMWYMAAVGDQVV